MKKILILTLSLVLILTACSGVNTNKDKKAILIVSFGTSFIESRKVSIDATELAIEKAFPEYDAFTAFTSQIIIDVYKNRDQVAYDNVDQAIEKIYKEKYGEVLVVPTHVINGDEYDQIIEALSPFEDKFERFNVSKPLLSSITDYNRVAEALIKELPKVDDQTAIVLMGHGTHHDANSAYPALDYVMKHRGYKHIYVGTVEGFPEFDDVAADIKKEGYTNILLFPFMIVAGDHAHNDMAGDEEDSWKVMFKSQGYDVDYILKGMGELPAIQELFIEHAHEALLDEDA